MADKSRERNNVDLFSDYGLDEMQTVMRGKAAEKTVKFMFNSMLAAVAAAMLVTGIFDAPWWVCIAIFYVTMLTGGVYYAVKCSQIGALSPLFAFSSSTGGVITGIIVLFMGIGTVFAKTKDNLTADNPAWLMAVLCASYALYSFIIAGCAKKNDEAVKKQSEE